ncbi:MAG: glucuronate isomerase [Verrucomicrobia bacterium]|nr:glucuronate isomerase [Verrucomicrobiota bacterium]
MSPYIHADLLLGSPPARRLYHEYAADLPILDYHCHLDPGDLAADRRFPNLAQLWVIGDPYKHRAMRLAGVPERLITGDASDREKFDAWAATVPLALGNPLHLWTALELQRYFGIEEALGPGSADRIWRVAQARLAEPGFTARGLLRQRRVAAVCTSDRLLDDLSAHAALATMEDAPRVLPSLRADDVVAVESPEYAAWLARLGERAGGAVRDYPAFRAAVSARLDAFAAAGCRLSDHGLDEFAYVATSEAETAALYGRRASGEELGPAECVRLRSGLLRWLGGEYARRGWILQLHLSAQRRTSSRLRRHAGAAGGYAAVGRTVDVPSLCAWFDDLERAGGLPRVILYPLNPADFGPLAVLTGSFAEDGVAGRLQLGPAWWYNDHAHGMRAHLDAVASHSLLAVFLGMTTDSRSLLSMVRHEYFRRVFCDWLAGQARTGLMPDDPEQLGALVRAVCFGNARRALNL